MKLIYSIILRLSLALLPIIALWGALFYFALENEINDEADDALERYSDYIMIKVLSNQQLPQEDDGSNNTFRLILVDSTYANNTPHIEYYDTVVKISSFSDETEPARVLRTIFQNADNEYYELTVSMPTFEKEDLINTILNWIITLYILLLVIVISISGWVIYKNLLPLYKLLDWLRDYTPGKKDYIVNIKTSITEFKRLNLAVQNAANRSEILYEKQNQFIGNASHELQTPLSIITNRVDLLLDNTSLTKEQISELLKIKQTVNSTVKLNKALLLLTKIENNHFPEAKRINICKMIKEIVDTFKDIYSNKNITCILDIPTHHNIIINDSLAHILISNLIKNAFIHTPDCGNININLQKEQFIVANSGYKPLDKERIFDRFYQGSKKEGSSGLGLAIVNAIAKCYNYKVEYNFINGMHTFSIINN